MEKDWGERQIVRVPIGRELESREAESLSPERQRVRVPRGRELESREAES